MNVHTQPKPNSDQARQKTTRSQIGERSWQDPEIRARRLEGIRRSAAERRSDPAAREKMLRMLNSPERREKMRAACQSPEFRERMRAQALAAGRVPPTRGARFDITRSPLRSILEQTTPVAQRTAWAV